MKQEIITSRRIRSFQAYLQDREKAWSTVQKYVREIEHLQRFLEGRAVTKAVLLEYRNVLQEKNQAQTVNGNLPDGGQVPFDYTIKSGCIEISVEGKTEKFIYQRKGSALILTNQDDEEDTVTLKKISK